MIEIIHHDKKVAKLFQDGKREVLSYESDDLKNSIALSLPNTQKIFMWENRFAPYFETFLPEGYLFEIFKNILTKEYGTIDDHLLFSLLAPNIEGRMRYRSDRKPLVFDALDIDEILANDTPDTFTSLLQRFLDKNAIGGVQPKTVAILKDKETIDAKEYIVKTWGEAFPYLAENEYFCLKTVEKAGVPIPNIRLSKNRRFLVVEKFTRQNGRQWGFEEVISLMDKNRIHKYQGSYEQVAKTVYAFVNDAKASMVHFFKTIVMNFLLKNGDAHLKNFALLFSDDFSLIRFAPAYDIVTTTAYIFKDKPALTLEGRKLWYGKKELVRFAQTHCRLSKREAEEHYQTCIDALRASIEELESYIDSHPHFRAIGTRILDSWRSSLSQQTHKAIDNDVIRSWKNH